MLPLTATSDDQGRYEIRGARKGKAYVVEVESDPTGGYMAAQVHPPDTPGYDPIDMDIEVKKGGHCHWPRDRRRDEETGGWERL